MQLISDETIASTHTDIVYNPTPTARLMHQDTSFCRALMGPVGSGKSVACCWEVWMKAHAQEPAEDGIRYSRWAVVRNTYRELQDTTIKTWFAWFDEADGKYNATQHQSVIYTHKLQDGTSMHMEILFRALDHQKDVKKLLSLELTGAWVNEAREIRHDVFAALTARVGRYPAGKRGRPTWKGVLIDTNPPDSDHWFVNAFAPGTPKYKLFRQPSALSADAENLSNLEPDYYENLMAGKTDAWLKVYVHGEYGFLSDDAPVYPEFNTAIHTLPDSADLIPSTTVYIGIDFGLTPAAVFAFQGLEEQWVFFHEIVSFNMGAMRFGEVMGQYIRKNLRDNPLEIWGDPAGEQRAQTDETTPFEVLQTLGINAQPAPTNDYTIRRESVASCLTKLTTKGKPKFGITPGCPQLLRAMQGGYHYKRVQVSGDDRYRDKPDKNKFSHVAEAAQYLLVGAGEDIGIIGGSRAADLPPMDYSKIAAQII